MNISTPTQKHGIALLCGLGAAVLVRAGLARYILRHPTLGSQLPLKGRAALAPVGSVAAGIATALLVHRVTGGSQAPDDAQPAGDPQPAVDDQLPVGGQPAVDPQPAVDDEPPVGGRGTPVEVEPLTLDNLGERFPDASWDTFHSQHALDLSQVEGGAATLLSCEAEVEWGGFYLAKVTLDACDDDTASQLFEKFPTLNLIRAGKDAWFNTNKTVDDPTRLNMGKVHLDSAGWKRLREVEGFADLTDAEIINRVGQMLGVPLVSYRDGDEGAFLLVLSGHKPSGGRAAMPLHAENVFRELPDTQMSSSDDWNTKRKARKTAGRLGNCIGWLFIHESSFSANVIGPEGWSPSSDPSFGNLRILAGRNLFTGDDTEERALFHAYPSEEEGEEIILPIAGELAKNLRPFLMGPALQYLGEEDIQETHVMSGSKGTYRVE